MQKATKSRGSAKPAQPLSQANVSGNEMEIDSITEDQVMPASKSKHNRNIMSLNNDSDSHYCLIGQKVSLIAPTIDINVLDLSGGGCNDGVLISV